MLNGFKLKNIPCCNFFLRLNSKHANGLRKYTNCSYIRGVDNEPLRALTLDKVLDCTTAKYPDREIIVSQHQCKRITYKDFTLRCDQLARGFRSLGLESGDRVGIWAPNLLEWNILNIACSRLGLIVVGLNPANEILEMKYSINKIGIKAMVCPEKIGPVHYYDILNQLSPELKNSEPGKLKSKNIPSLKIVIVLSDATLKGAYTYNEVYEKGNNNTDFPKIEKVTQPFSTLNIQFTSGTTGKSKATKLSHFNVVNNAFFIGKRNEFDRKHHKICVPIPFFHTFAYTAVFAAAITFGATMVLPSDTYCPEKNLKAIAEEKCSIIFGTPTMYVDLVSSQRKMKLDIAPEIAVTGGAPCSPQLYKDMKDILKLKKINTVYGQTEATCVAIQSLPVEEDEEKTYNTVGHVGDHLEVKIVDPENNVVPFGTPGELLIRGYSTMLGYWEDPSKTNETITSDGWLKTGDKFMLYPNGYAKIVGRLKDMIIRGGENIYPKEIEDFLNTHPSILEAQVVGLPHARYGEEVCACVRLREGCNLTKQNLVEYCKGQIAHFKIPSQLRIMQSFPKTESGKIRKNVLKEMLNNSQLKNADTSLI